MIPPCRSIKIYELATEQFCKVFQIIQTDVITLFGLGLYIIKAAVGLSLAEADAGAVGIPLEAMLRIHIVNHAVDALEKLFLRGILTCGTETVLLQDLAVLCHRPVSRCGITTKACGEVDNAWLIFFQIKLTATAERLVCC